MIEGNFVVGTKGLEHTGYIRSSVFTDEQGVAPSIERDVYDDFAHHLIIKDDEETVGTGRMIYKDNQYLIGRIAVLPAFRGLKYGDLIVRMLCTRAFTLKAPKVVVHAQVQVESFYSKIGFKRISDVYEEAGIEHVTMTIDEATFIKPCSCQGEGCCSK